jgi:hypothetical protein
VKRRECIQLLGAAAVAWPLAARAKQTKLAQVNLMSWQSPAKGSPEPISLPQEP